MTSENLARDWRRLVQQKLDPLDIESAETEEIAAELATHLEDLYGHYRDEGMPESRAIGEALREVPNWRELARKIRRARQKENHVNQRTKAVWIPGLVGLTLASGTLALLQVWGLRPQIVWLRSGLAALFYVPWLAAQPAFGAIGAYISRRNGGDWHHRLTASLLPAVALLAAFCVAFCFQIATNGITNTHEITFVGLGLYIILWTIVPGFGLALGALPFLGQARVAAAR